MKLLCISNGHGEDVIAFRILAALHQQCPSVQLSALPISGAGAAYRKAEIPIVGPTQNLPSGGFINRDPKQLARDVRGGLLALTRSQLSALKAWSRSAQDSAQDTGAFILAVGDIVPLLFAYLSGLPYGFVGTAKSEYWLRDERGKLPVSKLWERVEGWSGSVYLPWERWLMSRPRCRCVFVRDGLTAKHLQKMGLPAQYAGNPMMDDLAAVGQLDALLTRLRNQQLSDLNPSPARPSADWPAGNFAAENPTATNSVTYPKSTAPTTLKGAAEQSAASRANRAKATALFLSNKQRQNPLTIALLPGSRPPEAYQNWRRMLATLPGLAAAFPNRLLILLGAIAPSLSPAELESALQDMLPARRPLAEKDLGISRSYPVYSYQNITLLLVDDAYTDCLNQSEIAIATAGTATEQFVGLGKPAITLPGEGPQFTQAFATVQAKMLGVSVQMVGEAESVGPAIAKLMNDPDRLQLIYKNGKHRMGEPSAGQRIAERLLEAIGTSQPVSL
ncbi:MAG: lipid-A-disaccharide synthase-related protein [Cyanobacteria bacterium J06614_10]